MPTKPEPDDLLCFSVYAAANAFGQAYRPILKATGLTYPQFLVMLLLWSRGPLTVSTMGQALHLDSGTLTPLLKRLETQSLLTRTRDTDDERRVKVSLTAKGQALQSEVPRVMEQVLCATGMGLDAANALRDSLKRLRENLTSRP